MSPEELDFVEKSVIPYFNFLEPINWIKISELFFLQFGYELSYKAISATYRYNNGRKVQKFLDKNDKELIRVFC